MPVEISSTVAVVVGGVAIVGQIGTVIGLVKTWNRNGRNAATKYGELTTEVSGLKSDVKELTGVVTGMDSKVDKYQLETVGIVSGHEAKIENNAKAIGVIFNTMERRKTT